MKGKKKVNTKPPSAPYGSLGYNAQFPLKQGSTGSKDSLPKARQPAPIKR